MVSTDNKLEAQYWHASGPLGLYARTALRTSQFILSLVLIGLYSPDLTNATSTSSKAMAAWVMAIIICVLSGITCIIHVFATIKRVALVCLWDFVLMVVWAAITGTFGVIYTRNHTKENLADFTLDRKRMKAAVWLDLVMMTLWGLSSLQGCVWCCVARRVTRKTTVPGKETVAAANGDLEMADSTISTTEELERAEDNPEPSAPPPKKQSEEESAADNSMGRVMKRDEDEKEIELPPPTYTRFSI